MSTSAPGVAFIKEAHSTRHLSLRLYDPVACRGRHGEHLTHKLRFDLYGVFVVDLERVEERWVAYRAGEGKRRPLPELVVPGEIDEDGLLRYLDDLCHEMSAPGRAIRRIRQ